MRDGDPAVIGDCANDGEIDPVEIAGDLIDVVGGNLEEESRLTFAEEFLFGAEIGIGCRHPVEVDRCSESTSDRHLGDGRTEAALTEIVTGGDCAVLDGEGDGVEGALGAVCFDAWNAVAERTSLFPVDRTAEFALC